MYTTCYGFRWTRARTACWLLSPYYIKILHKGAYAGLPRFPSGAGIPALFLRDGVIMVWFYYLAMAGFGLIFGSFFNVVIYRTPREMGLGDRSICPNCKGSIASYDNIPLLSYLFLGGRCRKCRQRISIRYPLVEASTAALFVLVYWWSRNVIPGQLDLAAPRVVSPELFIGLVLASVVLIASAVDITDGIVPNRVMYPAMVIMLLLVTGIAIFRGQPYRIATAAASGIGGGGFLLAAGLIYGAVFMRGLAVEEEPTAYSGGEAVADGDDETPVKEVLETLEGESDGEQEDRGFATGIGMGDVKLLAFTGLALGYFHWYLVVVQLFIGFLSGALAAIPILILTRKGRKDRLPFAPFLAAGAIFALIWGQQLVDAYLKVLR